ncbi:MAG: UDP-N-acetylmuramoyl-L-alanyl-D-glutamate--2,6-diaminopimelate ligase [Firmicutes bacterium]|nr:UDP-N-acetylmuramoyl-L-alanyl-D-glutamate--2,6-diaminopimelate ligase [Candidatus Fermentithermobacillaceae bacterium]
MLLSEIASGISGVEVLKDAQVTGVSYDSRRVKPGDLFVAIKGFRFDGHDFLEDALRKGATAVLVEKGRELPVVAAGVALAEDTRLALAGVSAAFYGHPSRNLTVIGVTGTKGKTTTTHLIRNVLRQAGIDTGLVGTVHNLVGDEVLPVVHTTPEAPELQSLLARMVSAGCSAVVMEVSSHALVLHRVAQTAFDVAVLTNIGRDHLDFHPSFEDYLEAKKKLFRMLGESHPGHPPERKFSVVNLDDPESSGFIESSPVRCVTFGIKKEATVRGCDISLQPAATEFSLVVGARSLRVRLSMPGRFNVYNALAAASVAHGMGIDLETVACALENSTSVRGRAEVVDEGQPFTVLVDYAHTPDSLENVLEMIRETSNGEVIVIFGCGGDRDRGKRPLMGKVAATLADHVILTSDNPRSEEPEAIIEEIEGGVLEAVRCSAGRARLKDYRKIVSRFDAIKEGIRMARPGDVVLIAGKGHETYQVFKDRTVAFDDVAVSRQILRESMERSR